MDIINALNDILNFFINLIDLLNNTGENVVNTIQSLFPSAVETVLNSSDFNNMYDVMVPVGVALAAVFVGMDLIEKMTIEMVTVDKIIFMFVKLFVAITLITNGVLLFKGLNGISMFVVEQMQGALGVTPITLGESGIIKPKIDSLAGGAIELIVFLIKMFNPMYFILSLGDFFRIIFSLVLIPIAAYQRAIQIGYYCLASPIILSDTAGRGLKSSHSINFVFNLLKVFMEYPLIWLGLYLAFEVRDGFGESFKVLSFVIVCTTILFKSRSFAKTLF